LPYANSAIAAAKTKYLPGSLSALISILADFHNSEGTG
jgi:hypothetical protein